jgi:hypothetical protein
LTEEKVLAFRTFFSLRRLGLAGGSGCELSAAGRWLDRGTVTRR